MNFVFHKTITSALLLAGLAVLPASAQPRLGDINVAVSQKTLGQNRTSPNMQIFGATRAPFGYLQFCEQYRRDCVKSYGNTARMTITQDRWNELVNVNVTVNEAVRPVEDITLYKTIEYWTYPQGSGDCEDYVLEKRKQLITRGWPASALLITVVRDENNLGHAVLTVITDAGDFILDNKRVDILRWQETPYTYRKRQSQQDPMVWVALSPTEELRGQQAEQVSTKR